MRAAETWREREAAEIVPGQEHSEVRLAERAGVADSRLKQEFAEFV